MTGDIPQVGSWQSSMAEQGESESPDSDRDAGKISRTAPDFAVQKRNGNVDGERALELSPRAS